MECCTKKAVENHVEFVEKRQAARGVCLGLAGRPYGQGP